MTTPTPGETALQSLQQFIQGQLGTYHDDVVTIAEQINSDKIEWDGKLAEFSVQAQEIKDGTYELTLKAERVDEFHERLNNTATKNHQHPSADILDANPLVASSTVVKRDEAGLFEVAYPARNANPTTRSYVDTALGGKADSDHTHLSSSISDRTEVINSPEYPARLVSTQVDGFLHGERPVEDSHVPNKSYVDEEVGKKANLNHFHEIDGVTGLHEALEGKAASSHTHNSNDISNATQLVTGDIANAGLVIKTGEDGQLSVSRAGITRAEHVVSKEYVDEGLGKKSDTNHSHTVLQITGLQSRLDEKANVAHAHELDEIHDLPAITSEAEAEALVQRGSSGHVIVPVEPGAANTSVSRDYVDGKVDTKITKAGVAQTIWAGSREEFEALGEADKFAPGFIAVVI